MEDGESDLTDHINHVEGCYLYFIQIFQIHRLNLIANVFKSWKPLQISVTVNLKVGLV